MSDVLVLLYYQGRTVELTLSTNPTTSFLGSQGSWTTSSEELDRPLHHICQLAIGSFEAGCLDTQAFLPLVHGMTYDDCQLTYRYDEHDIHVEHLEPPNGSDDWPYCDYPAVFPKHHLEVRASADEPWSTFRKRTFWLPRRAPAELVVVIPTPSGIHFPLWPPVADPALVFEVSLRERRVKTYNVYD
jgi:hypothetical protein